MFKKLSLFFVSFIVIYFPFSLNALQLEGEIEKINKALFILKGTKNHAVVLRDAMKAGEILPPLERLKEASVQFLMGKDFNIETSEQKKRIFKDGLFRQLYMDALFFENLENMLFLVRDCLQCQKEKIPASFLKTTYGRVLKEIEEYLLKVQISFFDSFSDMFGQTETFHSEYYGFDFTREGGYALSGGSVTDNEKLFATKFCRSLKDSVQKEAPYSKRQIFNFKECMDELASSAFSLTSTLPGILLADFSEVEQLYEILEKGCEAERSGDITMYVKFCDFSRVAQSSYLRLGEKVCEMTSPRKVEQYLEKEARVDLDLKMSKYFDGIRDQFFQHIREVSIDVTLRFERSIGHFKNEAKKTEKKRLQKLKNAKKTQGGKISRASQSLAAEVEQIESEEEESFALEVLLKPVKALELGGEDTALVAAASAADVASDLGGNLDPWWMSYQKPPKARSRSFQRESGETPSALRFELTRKAFHFFAVMGKHSAWDPNLTQSDLNAFQSEIFREAEAFLGKDVSLHPVFLKARHFARPPLILPNLNPRSKASEPYLLFRMPHLPHGREENSFYPALRNFYEIYFQEAGLSVKNVFEK